MAATPASIADIIIGQAVKTGGQTWTRIAVAMRLYVKGYSQSLIDIAEGVAVGDIDLDDGKQYALNATFLLSQAVANMSQIVFHQVQSFLNAVLNVVKGAINASLGVALL